ncbi:MAG: hypothetical protein ABI716_02870, partial [Candidatus Saccharibacteria bacterium]
QPERQLVAVGCDTSYNTNSICSRSSDPKKAIDRPAFPTFVRAGLRNNEPGDIFYKDMMNIDYHHEQN